MAATHMLKAALPSIPGVNLVPGVRKAPAAEFTGMSRELSGVHAQAAHVAKYAEVCGFPTKETLPITYPHMASFDLQMDIMSDSRFPYSVLGMVHIDNTISSHRPIGIGESLDYTVGVGQTIPHPRGVLLDFVTTVSAGDEVVWEEHSRYLRRGEGDPQASRGLKLPPPPAATTSWRLPANLGREYAAVSGDFNPIHLSALSAKPFGFPRAIAHGMWTKARCLAAVENRLPEAVQIEVGFKRPVLLPATVGFGLVDTAEGLQFGLTDTDGAPHLTAVARPL